MQEVLSLKQKEKVTRTGRQQSLFSSLYSVVGENILEGFFTPSMPSSV